MEERWDVPMHALDPVPNAVSFPKTLYSSAWSISRHELIAGAAEKLLQNASKTQQRIASILAPLEVTTLASIAGWADEVKRRAPQDGDDADTIAFLKDSRNKHSDTWHFVDLPLDCAEYSKELYPEFTGDEDVVHMIHQAINCLTSGAERFSPLNALRLVVHLVGDVHQPLHVGCSYLRETPSGTQMIVDPKVIAQESLKSDRGGNRLILPLGSKGANLHSYWDSTLGGHPVIGAFSAQSVTDYGDVRRLYALASSDSPQKTETYDLLAVAPAMSENIEQWATASLTCARQAYLGLRIDTPEGQGYRVTWDGKQAYDSRCTPILQERLTTAARNLAHLLMDIFENN
jgi:hypothetical protein